MQIEGTATKLSKEVLLDLMELLNEYDIKLYNREGTAKYSRQIQEYYLLLGQVLRPLS